ncbi:chorismate mutase [Rivularia sp. PCC 7116]|uniref:chorismate mutase n=1 Tax=Rivularia sp. PCC 7116 TaxID=373994 RepID=UPI0012FA0B98|nr:chorismate mutase [Rivularia sp. PCC 7116]
MISAKLVMVCHRGMRKYFSLVAILVFLLIAFIIHPQVISVPINYQKATVVFGENPVKSCNSKQFSPANRLWCLIYERERLMKEVAANKYPQKKPIYDGVREIAVLDNIGTIAKKNKLPVREMQLYSQIVMDVSRQIQQYWFDLWKNESTTAKLSLNQIRQRIDQIDEAIVNSFGLIRGSNSITFEQIQDGLRKSLADLDGIYPSSDRELFIDLLSKVIYSVVNPIK